MVGQNFSANKIVWLPNTLQAIPFGVQGLGGQGVGVLGSSAGPSPGVVGHNNNGSGPGVAGINGNSKGATSPVGVWGESTVSNGVFGSGHGQAPAVSGFNDAPPAPQGAHTLAAGVWGDSKNADGVVGVSHSSQHAGVFGTNDNGGNAGNFLGNVNVTGAITHNGDYTTTGTLTVDKDIILSGADCAEEFDVGTATRIEPGTVMVLDDSATLQPSEYAYDKKVAGVISGAGDYRPGLILDRANSSQKRMPLALVGKVYCKVDAQYAPIEVGDLLTTSPTLGHAMRAVDPSKAFGAVIGKALRPLRSGQGLVPILIALQ